MTDPYQQQPNQQGQYYGADGYPTPQQPQQPPSAPLPVPYSAPYSAPYSGGYPVQPYSQPMAYAPYPPGYVPVKQSGLAIAGMIIGILALITFWVPFWDVIAAITAIALSWAGMVQAGKPGYGGNGMAIAGLVCGIIAAIPAVIFLIIFLTLAGAATSTCAFYC